MDTLLLTTMSDVYPLPSTNNAGLGDAVQPIFRQRSIHFRPIRYEIHAEIDQLFGMTSHQKRQLGLRVRDEDGKLWYDGIEQEEFRHLLPTPIIATGLASSSDSLSAPSRTGCVVAVSAPIYTPQPASPVAAKDLFRRRSSAAQAGHTEGSSRARTGGLRTGRHVYDGIEFGCASVTLSSDDEEEQASDARRDRQSNGHAKAKEAHYVDDMTSSKRGEHSRSGRHHHHRLTFSLLTRQPKRFLSSAYLAVASVATND